MHTLFGQAAGYAEEYEGLSEPVKAPRDWRKEESLSVPRLLRGLAKDMRDYALPNAIARYQGKLRIATGEGISVLTGERFEHYMVDQTLQGGLQVARR